MDVYNKTLDDILRWGRMGIIACLIAERLHITPLEALKGFFRSRTCERLHDRRTGLYLHGELYIANDYLSEIGA